jgi:hypothetical protein
MINRSIFFIIQIVIIAGSFNLIYGLSDSKLVVKGYKGIQFGITKDEVKTYLNDSAGLKQSADPYSVAEDEFADREDRIFFFIELDEKQIEVNLFFTSNNLFYYQQYSTKKLSANYFETEIKSDATYLSLVFKKKYGQPVKKNDPSFSSVSEGLLTYFWTWKIPGFEIFTALSAHESEYRANAIIVNKKLDNENRNKLKKQDNEKLNKAAKEL